MRWLSLMFFTLLSGCGPPSMTCTLILGNSIPGFITKCPPNTILIGLVGTQLTCAEVSVSCPVTK
jgi:hypothetical protein